MKLTDLALIFVGVFLPVVIIVYINTSFVVKAEKQEMYYKNLMNSAITDAVSSMKHIENEDQEIDYGYSGIVDKKVSINSKVAIDTFYNSLANNFNIKDNEMSLERLKMYIPVIAVLDYDGIYIHSAEEADDGSINFVTKNKVYYTYNYVIQKKSTSVLANIEYEIVELDDTNDIKSLVNSGKILDNYMYEITFTMDDYVYLNIYELKDENYSETAKLVYSKNFYLTDSKNNQDLVYGYSILSSKKSKLITEIVELLQTKRKQVIAEIGMREISYAVNKHNDYAKTTGINYTFRFSVESDATWYETMDGIGMIAVIQGISLGNRYLNYKAYSASDLIVSRKYYVSEGVEIENMDMSYLERNLYHASENCTVYKSYLASTDKLHIPSYYVSRAEAATNGFYPCPVCKP